MVLVNDCGANEFVFSDMLYSLLVGKGIIKDQRIVRGDLDDAVCTSSNTSLFYFIMETWDFGNHDGFRWGIPQEESFRLLSRRKNIYITTMDRAQYEKAQEFDYFKAFFPHTVEIKDLREEEKVELLKCAAKEYGFTFDAKSFRNSDILKLPYPTLQTQLYSVIQNQLADADNTEFIMHASDFDPLAKKSDKKSNALEELDALIGLDSVKKCVREIVALRQMAEQIIRNKDENFSNARLIRKVFERTRMKQALRTNDNMISAEDIQAVFAESDMRALLDSVQVQRRIGFAG